MPRARAPVSPRAAARDRDLSQP